MPSNDKLNGQVALVTGATGGIGMAIVDSLIKVDVKVIAHGHNSERLEQLHEKYPAIITEQADLTDASETENLARRSLEHFGKLDILPGSRWPVLSQ